jgi:hypothetical protein
MAERREASRYPLEKACVLNIEGRQVKARVENLSGKGGLFRIMEAGDKAVTIEDLGKEASFAINTVTGPQEYIGEIIRLYFADSAYHIALRFWKDFPGPRHGANRTAGVV